MLVPVPQFKGKVSVESCKPIRTPPPPSPNNQCFVGDFRCDSLIFLFELAQQVFTPVAAHVTEQPHVSVQRAWLLRRLRRRPSSEQCEAKSCSGPRPNTGGVRSTKVKKRSHALEQARFGNGAVVFYNTFKTPLLYSKALNSQP